MGATTQSLRAEIFDKEIVDYSIDSRTVGSDELFFALSQPDYERAGFNGNFADAHNFIGEALAHGAVAAVARSERVNGDPQLSRRFELEYALAHPLCHRNLVKVLDCGREGERPRGKP